MPDGARVGLIISAPLDMHAHAVRHAAAQHGHRIVIVDSAGYPNSFDLSARFGDRETAFLRLDAGDAIDMGSVHGIWWRRPAPPQPSQRFPRHPSLSSTIEAEASHALFGTLEACVANSFNPVSSSRRAKLKPLQLRLARQLGLRIPDTLVTTDPDAVRTFYDELGGRVIYKLFEGTDIGLFETRRMKLEDLDELWRTGICPTIFQEYVPGEFDVRATVVGDRLFAARIDYRKDEDLIDSRFFMTRTSALALPHDLTARLVELTRSLGLTYAAIDMRYSEENGFTFFELNPEGQYLWTEIEAGLPISAAIAARILDL